MTRPSLARLALAFSFALAALPGCSVDGRSASASSLPAFDPTLMQSYVPRVTYKDLRDANASCRSTQCTIGGADWDCKGGGYCRKM